MFGNQLPQYVMISLDILVNNMAQGKKLFFVDSDFMSHKDNEGYGDAYLNVNQVAELLKPEEILYVPYMNSGFLNYKLVNGVPINNNGFVDCLYRIAADMGHNLVFSYRENYTRNIYGMNERALVIEVNK